MFYEIKKDVIFSKISGHTTLMWLVLFYLSVITTNKFTLLC